jgi:dephospho-CoA kinase
MDLELDRDRERVEFAVPSEPKTAPAIPAAAQPHGIPSPCTQPPHFPSYAGPCAGHKPSVAARCGRVRGVTRVVGLTGGIGTGKSTVARMLSALGAVVIDADAIVHRLQEPGSPALAEIAAAFGPEVLDAAGALDRARLAELVFRDPVARQRLNDLIHPKVGIEMLREMEDARRAAAPLVVLDIPLLFEGRRSGRGSAAKLAVDATVLAYCPRALQIERSLARDGCTRAEVERRVAAQLPIEEKRALADFVIDNSGSVAETERQVRDLYAKLTDAEPARTAR